MDGMGAVWKEMERLRQRDGQRDSKQTHTVLETDNRKGKDSRRGEGILRDEQRQTNTHTKTEKGIQAHTQIYADRQTQTQRKT